MIIWLKINLTLLLLSFILGILSPLNNTSPLTDDAKEKEIRSNLSYCVVYITTIILTFLSWIGMFVAAIWFV